MKLKLALVSALSIAAVSVGSVQAQTVVPDESLGTVNDLTLFAGRAPVGAFSQVFTFELLASGSSSYRVADFTLLQPLGFQTSFNKLALVWNPDGVVNTADDLQLLSAESAGGSLLGFSWGSTRPGNYYLKVEGNGVGASGGLYSGAISVSPVPEPETYAMMLAGLVAVGFLARRRG